MEFEFLPAVVAGFVGGVAMTAMMMMAKSAGMTSMDMALIEGAMFTGDAGKARAIGMFMHLVMMSAVVFGTIYALLFAALGTSPGNAWWTGALIGLVHGLIAGMAFAMMPAMHPRMGNGGLLSAAAGSSGGTRSLRLESPGLFGRNYGTMTPMGVLVAHVVFGLVLGLVYAWLSA